MKFFRFVSTAFAAFIVASVALSPICAGADNSHKKSSHHRQETKNNWRNIGIGSAAVGLLGLATHNNTLLIGGAAGAVYSGQRYEHDRRSQSKTDRARAAYYSRSTIMHNGHRYKRHITYKNGHKYYSFVRG